MMKLLQEIRGFAELAKRRPQPRSPGLLPIQMRSAVTQATLPRRKLSVRMVVQDGSGIPHSVKINHVAQNRAPGATFPAA
jgi:hypothetical protein